MTDDEWDALTPKQQQEHQAKVRAAQQKREASMKKATSNIAAFVRANPGAVIELDAGAVIRPGQIGRYQFHIEVDADSFERFAAKKGMK